MESGNYEAIARLQNDNWWYRSRRDLLRRALSRQAPFRRGLEVGCGAGSALPMLSGLCGRLVATDFHPSALARCTPPEAVTLAGADVGRLPFAAGSFDLVVCCDVLEHVDDVAAVRELERILTPTGVLVITVPAHRHLWSENDDFSRHRRRYRRSELGRLLEPFELLELSYWNFLMYPPTLAYCALRRFTGPRGLKNNLERIPRWANRPLLHLSRLENRVRGFLPTPTGTSLLAVARLPP